MGRTPSRRALILAALSVVVLMHAATAVLAQPKHHPPQLPGGGMRMPSRFGLAPVASSATAPAHAASASNGQGQSWWWYWELNVYTFSGSSFGSSGGNGYGYTPGYSIYSPSRPEHHSTYAYPNDAPGTEPRRRATVTRPRPTRSTPAEKTRAAEYVASGDAHFAQGKFLPAVERYRAAARVSPELSEPQFRQGLVLVAQGNYAGATRAFRRALALYIAGVDPPPASLEAICGASSLADTNRRLSDAMHKDALNPDLLVARGMQSLFTGDQERAGIYLSQAARLGALDVDRVAELLENQNATVAANAPQDAERRPTVKVSADDQGFIKTGP